MGQRCQSIFSPFNPFLTKYAHFFNPFFFIKCPRTAKIFHCSRTSQPPPGGGGRPWVCFQKKLFRWVLALETSPPGTPNSVYGCDAALRCGAAGIRAACHSGRRHRGERRAVAERTHTSFGRTRRASNRRARGRTLLENYASHATPVP